MRPLVLTTEQIRLIDERAVAWLADCTMADARGEKVSRFSDYLAGRNPKNLTVKGLLELNPAVRAVLKAVTK